jgi:hypothetical protein
MVALGELSAPTPKVVSAGWSQFTKNFQSSSVDGFSPIAIKKFGVPDVGGDLPSKSAGRNPKYWLDN